MSQEQFIRMVQATRAALLRFLVALCCGDVAMAEDLAQEAYIKAFLAIEELRDPNRFGPWVNCIAYRLYLNNRRASYPMADIVGIAEPVAVERADKDFDYQELYTVLGALPTKERSAILLYYIEGYTSKEIADIMAINVDAVRQLLTRGRLHMRKLFKENNYEPR